jgi:membrane protein DedA with SNARE-associated domain
MGTMASPFLDRVIQFIRKFRLEMRRRAVERIEHVANTKSYSTIIFQFVMEIFSAVLIIAIGICNLLNYAIFNSVLWKLVFVIAVAGVINQAYVMFRAAKRKKKIGT